MFAAFGPLIYCQTSLRCLLSAAEFLTRHCFAPVAYLASLSPPELRRSRFRLRAKLSKNHQLTRIILPQAARLCNSILPFAARFFLIIFYSQSKVPTHDKGEGEDAFGRRRGRSVRRERAQCEILGEDKSIPRCHARRDPPRTILADPGRSSVCVQETGPGQAASKEKG